MLSTVARTRRFGIPVLGVSLLASTLGLAGCNSQDLQEFFGDVGDSTSPPAGTAIPFEEMADEVGTHAAIEARVLIRSAQAYQSFFGHAPPADVDFGRQSVIFYAAGTKTTGGYDANILSLTRAGDQLVAITELVSPGAGCVVTEALTAPHVLIKFAAQNGASIQFFKKDRTNDCQPATNPCAAVLCPTGTHCESQVVLCVTAPCPPVADCVPGAQPVHCGGFAGLPCPGIGKCGDDPSDTCDPNAGDLDCGGICSCIQNVACIAGDVFDSSPSVCACVPGTPNPPPVRCGGIAGIVCPGGGKCVDDPSDGCDPNAGGADCGGICSCIQRVACIAGDVFDGSPSVCACVPKTPPACGPVCDIFCANGHAVDASGCPTCACNPAPAPAPR